MKPCGTEKSRVRCAAVEGLSSFYEPGCEVASVFCFVSVCVCVLKAEVITHRISPELKDELASTPCHGCKSWSSDACVTLDASSAVTPQKTAEKIHV